MENAAKALLIAGGVLIAIILLTLFAYLFSHMATGTSNIYSTLDASEISEFNQQFLNYQGRTDLNIQDVITIINLAKDNNRRGKFPTVSVLVDNDYNWKNKNMPGWNNQNVAGLLAEEIAAENKYTCTDVLINTSTKLVYQVKIFTN